MSEFAVAKPVHHDMYPLISPTEGLKDAAKGKTILITGAGTGIGKAIAHAFAQASASAIILVGRRLEPLHKVQDELNKEYSDCRTLVQSCDVSNEDAVAQLFDILSTHALELDVLISNAGANAAYTLLEDSDIDDWWAVFETNVKGPYLLTRAFLRRRSSDSPAVIVNTSSASAHNTIPTLSAYSVSKAALNRLTEFVAREATGKRVRCVAFNPGVVPGTGLTDKAPAAWMSGIKETAELGAGTCLYLTTEGAAWLNGRYIDARWDRETLEGGKARIESEGLLRMTVLGDARVMM